MTTIHIHNKIDFIGANNGRFSVYYNKYGVDRIIIIPNDKTFLNLIFLKRIEVYTSGIFKVINLKTFKNLTDLLDVLCVYYDPDIPVFFLEPERVREVSKKEFLSFVKEKEFPE